MPGAAEFELSIKGIASAPTKPGHSFGPCLLYPGVDNDWVVGRFNGDGWYDQDDYPIDPEFFALLPVMKR
jgi:hypothetical protein